VIVINQEPIGKTPRSNPATYTKIFDDVRKLFAATKDAKARGYKAGRFSFNVKGGRCETCRGYGTLRIEMNFLPDVYITCEDCNGKRYNEETLRISYKGKTIADVLDMEVEEAATFFQHIPRLARRLQTLLNVGLGYITLGQSSTTLSGGESQRIKITRELSKNKSGHVVYLLDEPTTGLHFEDTKRLIRVLNQLVDKGNTVYVIEHNLDVVKSCDYVLDLGPEGGDDGGYVLAQGTPEEVARNPRSYTGRFLKEMLPTT
jgi:excinuclease ABC subunit A